MASSFWSGLFLTMRMMAIAFRKKPELYQRQTEKIGL
jgi:hypothetical protein